MEFTHIVKHILAKNKKNATCDTGHFWLAVGKINLNEVKKKVLTSIQKWTSKILLKQQQRELFFQEASVLVFFFKAFPTS